MITQAREYVAGVLAPLGVPVHPYPPGTLTPPAAVIVPDSPYLELPTIASRPTRVGLEVQIITSGAAGPASARVLDGLIDVALPLLGDSAALVESIPAVTYDETSGLLTARIPVVVHWTGQE